MELARLTWSIALVVGRLPDVLPVRSRFSVGNKSRESVYELSSVLLRRLCCVWGHIDLQWALTAAARARKAAMIFIVS